MRKLNALGKRTDAYKYLFLLPLFITLGCRGASEADLRDGAIEATRELGIPVSFFALPEDECAVDQLQTLADSYLRLSSPERLEVRNRLAQKYRSITVNATRGLGRMEGRRWDVQLRPVVCEWHVRPFAPHQEARYQVCARKVVATMKMQDTRAVEDGAIPGTTLLLDEQAQELAIQPRSAANYSQEALFRADDTRVFAHAVKMTAAFEQERRTGALALVRERKHEGDLYCGRLLRIEDLL